MCSQRVFHPARARETDPSISLIRMAAGNPLLRPAVNTCADRLTNHQIVLKQLWFLTDVKIDRLSMHMPAPPLMVSLYTVSLSGRVGSLNRSYGHHDAVC